MSVSQEIPLPSIERDLFPATVPISVENNGNDDDCARNDLLNPVRQLHFGAAVCNNCHDESPDEAPEYFSLSNREAGPADNDSGDNIQFHPGSRCRGTHG